MNLSKLWPKLGWLIFYLGLAIILTSNSFGYLDPDFGWHLKVGQDIAKNISVPHDQIYMWPLQGKTWVDHEWLSNLLTAELFKIGGYILVSLFFIILPIIGLAILNYYVFKNYLKKNKEKIFFAGLEFFALLASLPHLGVRMQEFAIFLSIILFVIIDSCHHRQNIKLAWWLIPLIFIWSCLHGSFLLSIAVIVGWLGYEIILKLIPQVKIYFFEKELTTKKLLWLGLIVLISVISTLLTPYKQELYSFLSDYASNRYYLSHIEEWRTPYSISFAYLQIFYSQIIIVLIIGAKLYNRKNLLLWKMVLSLFLLILASRSVRHFPIWAIASLLFLAPSIIKLNFSDIKIGYKKIIIPFLFLSFLIVVISYGLKINPTTKPFKSYCHRYPCGAVRFLKDNPQYSNLKIFNDYGWGGFLISAWPEKGVFIDGRLPQYPIKNHSLLEEYSDFFKNKQLQKKLAEYNIELILFKAKEPRFQPDWFESLITGEKSRDINNPLLDYLSLSSDWQKIYSDDTSIIYVKK